MRVTALLSPPWNYPTVEDDWEKAEELWWGFWGGEE
jgi:hypothetical protein